MRSDRWVKPLSMRMFLEQHVQPTGGGPLLAPILASRVVVVDELKELWDATRSFIELPTTDAVNALNEATQEMSDATTALDEAIAPINAFIATLPPIEIELQSNPNGVPWDGSSTAFGMRPYHVIIRNIGLFTDGSHSELEEELKQVLRIHSTGWEYQIIECNPLDPHPFGGGTFGIESLAILDSQVLLDGPTAGLYDLDVQWTTLSYGNDRQHDVVLEDHLVGHDGHLLVCLYGTCDE